MNKRIVSLLTLMLTLLFVSCSSDVPPMQRDYADAVTNINQVDPYYRAYFRAQNSSNYTLADQRRAYIAAIQTSRTPVRASDYRNVSSSRLASRSSRKAYSKRRSVASRKAADKRRSVASTRKAVRGKRATASRKTSAKRRATASRRSTARRGSRRRG